MNTLLIVLLSICAAPIILPAAAIVLAVIGGLAIGTVAVVLRVVMHLCGIKPRRTNEGGE